MDQQNYWTLGSRRVSRRAALRGATLGVAGIAGAALIGCGSDEDTPPAASTGTAAPTGTASAGGSASATAAATADQRTDATLTAAIGSDVGNMDPQALGGTGGGNWPNMSTHFGLAGLTVRDRDTKEFLPNVALSWEETEDHLQMTYKLRNDVVFHNGDPLTAEDVAFSVDRNIGKAEYNPDFQAGYSAQFTNVIDRTEVVDDQTVTFHLKQPDVILHTRPVFLVPKRYIEDNGDEVFAQNPVGVGIFKFVSRVPDSEIVSERHEEYHNGFDTPSGLHPSYVKRLVQKIVPDSQARLGALQAGEIDLAHNISSDVARVLESDNKFKVHYLAGDQPMTIEMNTAMEVDPTTGEKNPFLDLRVRQAMNHAVDVQAIIDNLLTGREKRCFGSSRDGFGFPQDLLDQEFDYNPEKAKALLAEAGYPEGFQTTMVGPLGRWPNSRAVMEAVLQFIAEVGIRSTMQELQYQEIASGMQTNTIGPLVFFSRAGGDDPGANFRYNYHSTANFALGTIPEKETQDAIDRAIEASEVAYDPEERKEHAGEAIRQMYLSAKSVWLYEPVAVVATKSNWEWDIWAKSLNNPEYWNIRPV